MVWKDGFRFLKRGYGLPSGPRDFRSLSWLRSTFKLFNGKQLHRSGLSMLGNCIVFSSLITVLVPWTFCCYCRFCKTVQNDLSANVVGGDRTYFHSRSTASQTFPLFQPFFGWVSEIDVAGRLDPVFTPFLSGRFVNADAEDRMMSGLSSSRCSLYKRLHSSSQVGI